MALMLQQPQTFQTYLQGQILCLHQTEFMFYQTSATPSTYMDASVNLLLHENCYITSKITAIHLNCTTWSTPAIIQSID